MLAPWKKSYDQPRQHIKKQRHYLMTKVHIVKAMVFPVVMYGCESWTIKKAECQWIDAFEMCCWRRVLRVPWAARRSNQSILKEINPVYSLERLMLKLKLWYFGHLMWRTDSFKRPWCWERSKAGEGGDRGWDGWMASSTQWKWVWASSGRWWWIGKPGVLQSVGSQSIGHNWATELTDWLKKSATPFRLGIFSLRNWTEWTGASLGQPVLRWDAFSCETSGEVTTYSAPVYSVPYKLCGLFAIKDLEF